MNHEDNHDGPARAVRQLVELARAVPTSVIDRVDWDRVEQRLQDRIATDAARRRVGEPRWQRHGMVAAGVFAAAAAVLALMVTAPDGTPLRAEPTVGVALSSNAEPQTFALGAGARCTLGPNSRALLRCEGAGDDQLCLPNPTLALREKRGGLRAPTFAPRPSYLLVLEQGSVAADVLPQPPDAPLSEALVVEAGGVRVAVHGTQFSVVRGDRDVTVAVSRGAVTVGPAGHRGVTTGHLLVAPARAAFSIDDGRIARLLPPTAPPTEARQPSGRPATSPAAPDETSPAETESATQPPLAADAARAPIANAPAGPDAAQAPPKASDPTEPPPPAESPVAPPTFAPGTIDFAGARARIMSCLAAPARSAAEGDAVRVTISSQVRLRMDRDRRIISVRFNPPLKPELQQRCAGTVLGQTLAGSSDAPEFRVVFSPR